MALNFATFICRRRFSLGFSKCRWFRTSFKVPSRSTFFFSRRNARSTGSPFFSLTSLTSRSHPFATSGPALLPHRANSGSLPALPDGVRRTLPTESLEILDSHRVARRDFAEVMPQSSDPEIATANNPPAPVPFNSQTFQPKKRRRLPPFRQKPPHFESDQPVLPRINPVQPGSTRINPDQSGSIRVNPGQSKQGHRDRRTLWTSPLKPSIRPDGTRSSRRDCSG